MNDEINYAKMVEKALMDVVREALSHVAKYGLPGEQHFYITFKTRHPGVSIPAHLVERYPDEMTIVLQHQFWNLAVTPAHFSVDLSFNHKRENLIIPFAAVTAFADPSVQFGLQFSVTVTEPPAAAAPDETGKADAGNPQEAKPAADGEKAAEVITLDAFRKK